jgi:hypothetical protein
LKSNFDYGFYRLISGMLPRHRLTLGTISFATVSMELRQTFLKPTGMASDPFKDKFFRSIGTIDKKSKKPLPSTKNCLSGFWRKLQPEEWDLPTTMTIPGD